ncbi:MAG: phosphoglycerate kinase [Candidatus Paceibacterota bacterium]|jgi:3-phosphoglycerate kinase
MYQIEIKTEKIRNIQPGYVAIDCDPDEVQKMISAHFMTPMMFVYNGVAGIYESKYGIESTKRIILAIRKAKILDENISAIALGGEGVSAAIKVLGPAEAKKIFSHLSTAGGAGLEFWVNDRSFTALDSFPSRDAAYKAANYSELLTVYDINQGLKDKTVTIIADLNLEEPNPDDIKIQALIDDIRFAKENGAKKIIIMSHRGRPEDREERYSMKEYANIYTHLLRSIGLLRPDEEVVFIDDYVGEKYAKIITDLRDGTICITENARFHKEEKSKDRDIVSRYIADIKNTTGTEVLIFSAAGSAHRKDATKKYLPEIIEKKAIGILMQKEIAEMSKLRNKKDGPILAIIQGAKSDKLQIVKEIFEKDLVDKIMVLGKLALNFYNGNEVAAQIKNIAGNKLILPKRMTIAQIPERLDEKQFINYLKTQK